MKRVFLGLGLAMAAWSVTASAQLTGATVSGGSVEFPFPGFGVVFTPAGNVVVTVEKTSLEPTVIDFVLSSEPVAAPVPLSLMKFGVTDEDVQGLDFSLEGAFFAAVPEATFDPFVGTLVGGDNTEAALLAPLASLGVPSVDLLIEFEGGGTSAALTVTPIVPEPATGALVLSILLLIGRRGRG